MNKNVLIAHKEESIKSIKEEIKSLRKEQESIELSDFYTEEMFKNEFEHEFSMSRLARELENMDSPAFREEYNNYIDMLDREGEFIKTTEAYQEREEEIEELENTILEIEEEIEELEELEAE